MKKSFGNLVDTACIYFYVIVISPFRYASDGSRAPWAESLLNMFLFLWIASNMYNAQVHVHMYVLIMHWRQQQQKPHTISKLQIHNVDRIEHEN